MPRFLARLMRIGKPKNSINDVSLPNTDIDCSIKGLLSRGLISGEELDRIMREIESPSDLDMGHTSDRSETY